MRKRVLWIEDAGLEDLAYLASPLNVAGVYDLETTLSPSEAWRKIKEEKFDVVVVDIRIPPGDDKEWTDVYRKYNYDKISARLGMILLYSLLKPADELALVKLKDIPPWVAADKFAVLSIEPKYTLKKCLRDCRIKHYRQKSSSSSPNMLLELVEEILQKKPVKKGGNR